MSPTAAAPATASALSVPDEVRKYFAEALAEWEAAASDVSRHVRAAPPAARHLADCLAAAGCEEGGSATGTATATATAIAAAEALMQRVAAAHEEARREDEEAVRRAQEQIFEANVLHCTELLRAQLRRLEGLRDERRGVRERARASRMRRRSLRAVRREAREDAVSHLAVSVWRARLETACDSGESLVGSFRASLLSCVPAPSLSKEFEMHVEQLETARDDAQSNVLQRWGTTAEAERLRNTQDRTCDIVEAATREVDATVCWMSETAAAYRAKQGEAEVTRLERATQVRKRRAMHTLTTR